jgi:hypothetical protein
VLGIGAEYRRALHDGCRIWVIGDGLVEDVTVHPATRAVVDEYAAEWQDIVLTPPDENGNRLAWGYVVPKSAADSFGGGGYTARQRSALLQIAWDHVSSALDGRGSAFESDADGGMPTWRTLADAAVERASYWDALLVATAGEVGCTTILTEDMSDGSTLSGLTIHNPFAALGGLTDVARRLLALPNPYP